MSGKWVRHRALSSCYAVSATAEEPCRSRSALRCSDTTVWVPKGVRMLTVVRLGLHAVEGLLPRY
jgi:hypothetical protein